jgi:outer membrane protein
MKGILLAIVILLLSVGPTMAQKFGYIDSEYVLSKMPEYIAAQKQLDQDAANWRKEVQNLRIEVKGMYDALQAEEILLTKEMKEERLADIRAKELEVENYEASIFGLGGRFFIRQQELIKPILDKIYEAVEVVCKKNRLDFLFDKASGLVMLYTNPRHDYSDFVMEELGLKDSANPKR